MNPTQRKLLVLLVALFALQMATSYAISTTERELTTPGLERVPQRIGSWKMASDQALDPILIAYLKPDEYLLRDYVKEYGNAAISVVVMYFKSLKTNYGPHAPRICLPGSGWIPRSAGVISIPVGGGSGSFQVNRYLMQRSGKSIAVLYWYQNSRRSWAEEFQTKLYLLPDLLQYQRSDVSLVRLSTAIDEEGESLETHPKARELQEFASSIHPLLAERFR